MKDGNRHTWLTARTVALAATLFAVTLFPTTPAYAQAAADPQGADRQWAVFDSLLRAHYPADGPGAAAIVVHDDRVLYHGAAGSADLTSRVPMQPDAVFNIASITKQFTGVAILMLVDEGRVALTDPITRFFPDYPTGGRTVTVEHLLAHTAGLHEFTSTPEFQSTAGSDVSLDQLVALFRDQPFQFEPGASWAYNNSGYVLLGAIIEQVSGQSYGAFLRSRIFEPLGMTSTHYAPSPALLPDRPAGYSFTPQGWVPGPAVSLTTAHAAGGLVSTVDDLALWDTAIQRGELLSATSWQRAFTSGRLNDGSPTSYGAGWMIGRLGHLETAEHGGDLPGWHAVALRVPAERLYVAILTNASWPPPRRANSLVLDLASRTLGVPLELPEVPLAADMLPQYTGVYRIATDDERVVRLENGRLNTQRGSGPVTQLYPVGEDQFGLPGSGGAILRFIREEGGIVAAELLPRAGPPNVGRRVD